MVMGKHPNQLTFYSGMCTLARHVCMGERCTRRELVELFFYSIKQLSSDFVSVRLLDVMTALNGLSLIRLLLALER